MIVFRFLLLAALSVALYCFTDKQGLSAYFMYILVALELAHLISLFVRKKRVRFPLYILFYALITIIYFFVLKKNA